MRLGAPADHELSMERALEEYLSQQGICWDVLPKDRYASLLNEWQMIYGRVWAEGRRLRTGYRAQDEYARRRAEVFVIVFLGSRTGPPEIGVRRARATGYECRGSGILPDLSAYCSLEFFVSPADMAWTMVHTHEDLSCGGPYFVRKEWA